MSCKTWTAEEIQDQLNKDNGQPATGVVPTDDERFGRAMPGDSEGAKNAKDPFLLHHQRGDIGVGQAFSDAQASQSAAMASVQKNQDVADKAKAAKIAQAQSSNQ